MLSRRSMLFVVAAAVWSMGASYRTENFTVEVNADARTAQTIGQWAEYYRKEKAVQWLGQEMPAWGKPCPLKVTIKNGGAGGATTFAFDRGAILSQEMNVEGPLNRVIDSVLPHEITHTVFAFYMREPLPRWADEGGSVYSEDNIERQRHDELIRRIAAHQQPNCRGAFHLRYLWDLREYPKGQEVMTLYAQGFSVSQFLVEKGGRQKFLAFVAQGMKQGWDAAVRTHYGMNSVEDVERAWIAKMTNDVRSEGDTLVRNSKPAQPVDGQTVSRTTPTRGVSLATPVVRGQAPSDDEYPRPTPPAKLLSDLNRDGWSPVNPRSTSYGR